MRKLFTILNILNLLLSNFLFAVNIRHDIDESEYIKFSENEWFKSGLVITRPFAEIPGSGVLIHKNYILTAGHVGSINGKAWMPIKINNVKYMVDYIYLFPDYSLDKNPEAYFDISIMHIAGEGVKAIEPAALWSGSVKRGMTIYGVGYGRAYTGILNSSLLQTGIFRAYENKIDYILDDKKFNMLIADFDSPDKTGNSLKDTVFYLSNKKIENESSEVPLRLEGSPAEGDSGSGIWIKQDDKYFLTGITHGRFYNCYGAQSLYVNLTNPKIREWITSIIKA